MLFLRISWESAKGMRVGREKVSILRPDKLDLGLECSPFLKLKLMGGDLYIPGPIE